MQKLTPTKLYRNENINYMNIKKTPPSTAACKRSFQCMNHPTKRAKYCMPRDQSVSLCSKCAVNMVGKGFKVEELQGCTEDMRKDQITKFLAKVHANVPLAEKLKQQLIAKKEDIMRHHEQQREKVSKFYQQLITNLEMERENVNLQLAANYSQLSTCYDEAVVCLDTALRESMSMQRDIEQNVNRIIHQIELEPFNEIMQSYTKNVEMFQQKQDEISKVPIDVLKVVLIDGTRLPQLNELVSVVVVKTSLIKKSLQEKLTTNESMYVSFENKDNFTMKKQIQMPRTPKEPPIPVKHIDLYEQEFEEGHSQMIEREDIENSYQMLLYDHDDDQEEEGNFLQQGVKLFSSPQFKDN